MLDGRMLSVAAWANIVLLMLVQGWTLKIS
jgi:hypothetical protein